MNKAVARNEFLKRVSRLRQGFAAAKIDALLVSCDENVRYFSGFSGGESFLIILQNEMFLMTDFRYTEQAENEVKGRARIIERKDLPYPAMIRDFCRQKRISRLGFESNRVGYELWEALKTALGDVAILVPCRGLAENQRMVKSPAELTTLRQAVEIMRQTYIRCLKTVKAGISERDIQAQIEFISKGLGSEKPAFNIIVAAGRKSSMPHAVTGAAQVGQNDLVLIDMGIVHQGYHTDLTRCTFVGRITASKRKVYEVVLEAQKRAISVVRDGVPANAVDAAARDYIRGCGYGDYFGHSTGHGVGLEIHEPPSVSSKNPKVLTEGMVVTVEPGIYLPGQFGVRIEDMVLVTRKGCEVLTAGIPKYRFK